MLEQENAHPRDARITFFPEDHRYEVDGKSFISVTTVVKQFFEEFDPNTAIGKMGPNHPLYGKPPEEIKRIWRENGERASARGTELHKQIEVFLNTGDVGDMPEFKNFHRIWQTRKRGEPYRTEWVIYDEKRGIAGTIDYIYKMGDQFAMTDWKRSKKIRYENRWRKALGPISHLPDCNYIQYCLQQNVYRLILLENYGIDIRKMSLLQMHGDLFQPHNVPMMEQEARMIMAHAHVPVS